MEPMGGEADEVTKLPPFSFCHHDEAWMGISLLHTYSYTMVP